MNQFQNLVSRATETRQEREQAASQEDATMRAADRLAQEIHFRPLSFQEKAVVGPVLHYAFGTGMGALYGLTAEYFPEARAGFGTIFGTLLFAIADEAAVPLTGLSSTPNQYPISSHLRALASHLVYGASTEAVRITLTRAA